MKPRTDIVAGWSGAGVFVLMIVVGLMNATRLHTQTIEDDGTVVAADDASSLGESSPGRRFWAGFGGSGAQRIAGPTEFTLSALLAMQQNEHLFSLHAAKGGQWDGPELVWSTSLMYGRATTTTWGHASASTGLGMLGGKQWDTDAAGDSSGNFSGYRAFTTPAVAAELRAGFRAYAIGADIFLYGIAGFDATFWGVGVQLVGGNLW